MEISYKLENFEGPLDLLLHLIEKNKVSIYDIPIVLITEQYLAYVSHMEKQDLDVVSDFLVMAATLIAIKSKMLLPADEPEDEEEEDPRAELVRRLLEYKTY
ncbi:MAG: segregation/condensation protein A, partial [Clostridium sp.]